MAKKQRIKFLGRRSYLPGKFALVMFVDGVEYWHAPKPDDLSIEDLERKFLKTFAFGSGFHAFNFVKKHTVLAKKVSAKPCSLLEMCC